MKKINLTERRGFAQVFLLVGMLLIAISLPIATKLVQQNQENRSNAAAVCKCSKSGYGSASTCAMGGGTWKCTYPDPIPTKKPTAVPTKKPTAVPTKKPTAVPTKSQCTNNTAKCSSGQMYFCNGGQWQTADACKSGVCNSSGTACQAVTATCTEGATKCTGARMYKCDGGSWVGQSTCPSGSCNSAGTACGAVVSPSTGCSSSACGKCSDSTSCTKVGCSWGYNGSSSMYCYPKSSAVPTSTTSSCTVGSYTCKNGDVWYCKQDQRTDGVKSGTWGLFKDCTDSCSVVNGTAQCGPTTGCSATNKNATKCQSGNVYTCNGTAWAKTQDCSNGCNVDGGGKAQCDSANCTVDQTKCVGSSLYTCKKTTSGTIWDIKVCEKGCSSGKCKTGGSGGSGGDGGGGGYYPDMLSVVPSTLTLKVGESATITATEPVTWSSDAATIATVTADGVVTGVAVGTANITATNSSGATAIVAVKVIADGTGTLSFKVAFAGIKPYYTSGIGSTYNCLGSLGNLAVEVLNRPTNAYEKFSDVSVYVERNEVDSKGNQVFRVNNLQVGSSLSSVNTFNYVKVKGAFHLKRRMCKDGQTGKMDETTTCDINLKKTDGYVYNFSEYTLLAGDVDVNGIINSVDFSLVKNAVNADSEPECGRQYDLNMDGVVNSLDLNLVKDSLSSIDDE